MTYPHISFETYSPLSLPSVGVWAYAEQAQILLCAWAFDDGPVAVSETIPQHLLEAFRDPDVTLVAHNSMFERVLLQKVLGIQIPLQRWRCTMVMALYSGLPASLWDVCHALGLGEVKKKSGRRLIPLFSKPKARNRKTQPTPETHPEEWEEFQQYCMYDVIAEREVFKRLPQLPPAEHRLWILDQTINDRGYAVDRSLAKAARDMVSTNKRTLDQQVQEFTNGMVSSTRATEAFRHYLNTKWNANLPDLRTSDLRDFLSQGERDPLLTTLIQNREYYQAASKTSVSKYDTLLQAASPDGRLRGTLQFDGASRTGRWSGRVFQPQNLPRPSSPYTSIGIECIKDDCAEVMFDDLLSIAADCVRGCIVAAPGKKRILADLSSIEARVLAWVTGEREKLAAFAKGEDLYRRAYARAFGVSVDRVNTKQRTIGKVMELALGYGGGAKAFASMAAALGLDLKEMARQIRQTLPSSLWEDARDRQEYMKQHHPLACLEDTDQNLEIKVKEAIKYRWRQSHPSIVAFWKKSQEICRKTVQTQGSWLLRDGLVMHFQNDCLLLELPSKRCLFYPYPKEDLSYMGTVPIGAYKWERLRQMNKAGFSQRILCRLSAATFWRMASAEQEGYSVVLTVHDEIVTEVPPEFTLEGLCRCMTTPPSWASDLELAAEGYEAERYRK